MKNFDDFDPDIDALAEHLKKNAPEEAAILTPRPIKKKRVDKAIEALKKILDDAAPGYELRISPDPLFGTDTHVIIDANYFSFDNMDALIEVLLSVGSIDIIAKTNEKTSIGISFRDTHKITGYADENDDKK